MKASRLNNPLNLDSLTDVLTNTVGALVLLCVLAALGTQGLTLPVYVTQESRVETTAETFLVLEGLIYPVDMAKVRQVIDDSRENRWVEEEPTTDFPFEVAVDETEDGQGLTVRLEVALPGERVEKFLRGEGNVAEQVSGLNPKETHVRLRIHPSSFRYYSELRWHLIDQGFRVGWDPMERRSIGFSYHPSNVGRYGLGEVVDD